MNSHETIALPWIAAGRISCHTTRLEAACITFMCHDAGRPDVLWVSTVNIHGLIIDYQADIEELRALLASPTKAAPLRLKSLCGSWLHIAQSQAYAHGFDISGDFFGAKQPRQTIKVTENEADLLRNHLGKGLLGLGDGQFCASCNQRQLTVTANCSAKKLVGRYSTINSETMQRDTTRPLILPEGLSCDGSGFRLRDDYGVASSVGRIICAHASDLMSWSKAWAGIAVGGEHG